MDGNDKRRLGELRARAEQLTDPGPQAIAVRRAILDLDPTDAPTAVRLGRMLQDLRRYSEALEAFRHAASLGDDHPTAARIALKRIAEMRSAQEEAAVHNVDAPHGSGLIYRKRAQRDWPCEGKGAPPTHTETCVGLIRRGTPYIEDRNNRVAWMDSHRVCVQCARDLWGWLAPEGFAPL